MENLDDKINQMLSEVPVQKIELNNEQQLLILKRWENDKNPPSIMELVKLAFPHIEKKLQDGRSLYGRIVKKFLTEKGLDAETKTEYIEKKVEELTPEQKEYVMNNCTNMRPFEMAKEVFQNQTLTPACTQVKMVVRYLKSLPDAVAYADDDSGLEIEYKPPKQVSHVVARIFKYVKDNRIDKDKLTPMQKKQAEALIGYLHDYRLIHQINTYENIEDKRLFESSFISYTWDKPDLSAEDVHLYIILCTEVVMSASIQRTINLLQCEQDRQMEENDGKISMTIVEAVGTARTEYNGSVKRQETLFKSLITERSKRLEEKIGQNASLLNLIETWKAKETRDKMIRMAQERKEKLSNEIDRLETMDDLKVKIMGISKNEILEG